MRVQVLRGNFVESSHHIDGCLLQGEDLVQSWGEGDKMVFARSTIKPLQALAIFTSGAYEKFNITEQELAVACASHSGEAIHTDTVANWLKKMGLSTESLKCGGHWPEDEGARSLHLKAHLKPTPLTNNCSGKHAGLLAVALAFGEDVDAYFRADSKTQLELKKNIEQLIGRELTESAMDGCSIPTYRMSLREIAFATGRLFEREKLTEHFCEPAAKITAAFLKYSALTSGSQDFCHQLMKISSEPLLLKVGAEGMMVGVLPQRRMSFCLKARDGAFRAVEAATLESLLRMGLFSDVSKRELLDLLTLKDIQVI